MHHGRNQQLAVNETESKTELKGLFLKRTSTNAANHIIRLWLDGVCLLVLLGKVRRKVKKCYFVFDEEGEFSTDEEYE